MEVVNDPIFILFFILFLNFFVKYMFNVMDEKAPFLHVRETYSGLRNCAFLHFESKNANSFGLDILSIPIFSEKIHVPL